LQVVDNQFFKTPLDERFRVQVREIQGVKTRNTGQKNERFRVKYERFRAKNERYRA